MELGERRQDISEVRGLGFDRIIYDDVIDFRNDAIREAWEAGVLNSPEARRLVARLPKAVVDDGPDEWATVVALALIAMGAWAGMVFARVDGWPILPYLAAGALLLFAVFLVDKRR